MKQNGSNAARHDHQLYEIGKSTIQGRGVFATRRIRRGPENHRVHRRATSPNDEADRRYDEERMERHHTFLFTLDDDSVHRRRRADNNARLINHSCDPNCEAIIDDERIWIYALKNIQPGYRARLRLQVRAHRRRKELREVLRLPLRLGEMQRQHHGSATEAPERRNASKAVTPAHSGVQCCIVNHNNFRS